MIFSSHVAFDDLSVHKIAVGPVGRCQIFIDTDERRGAHRQSVAILAGRTDLSQTGQTLMFQPGDSDVHVVGITLNHFEAVFEGVEPCVDPAVRCVESRVDPAFRRVKPRIHGRTQVDVKCDVGPDTDHDR